jgi:hypothetical protein
MMTAQKLFKIQKRVVCFKDLVRIGCALKTPRSGEGLSTLTSACLAYFPALCLLIQFFCFLWVCVVISLLGFGVVLWVLCICVLLVNVVSVNT